MSIMLGKISVKDLHGPLADFMDKLQCKNGEEWFNMFKRFLRKEPCWVEKPITIPVEKFSESVIESTVSETPKVWKVWKTIKLGTGLKKASNFRRAVKSTGMKINNWTDDIFGKSAFTVAENVTEVELVACSVAELGFKRGATCEDIYARAKELGLDLCPPEAGPQLRLQYTDQPKHEWVIIAMEPITDLEGDLYLFCVDHDSNALWLSICSGSPYAFWDGDDRFVFIRRK